MRSNTPKALHSLCGRPMLDWALKACPPQKEPPIAILGWGAEEIQAQYQDRLRYALQREARGTGGALLAARNYIEGWEGRVLVRAADLPLLTRETVGALVRLDAAAAFLTTRPEKPEEYGRVLREDGRVRGIVEVEDVNEQTRLIREARVSCYCFDAGMLLEALHALERENPLGEITMANVIGWFVQRNASIAAQPIAPEEALGVNDRVQLAACTAALRGKINRRHMLAGVTMIDPAACYIDDTVKLGRDCTVYPGVVLEGNTVIGEGTVLYPACRLVNTCVGSGCALQGVVANEAVVGDRVTAGPYVNLRPNARIANGCKIGNYIEVKNSNVGEGSKLPHLSYIGDSDIGSRVNLGCGTVTVNYDGRKKHRTRVDDDAFIGCHTSLVAPVHVGKRAFTAAGSVITEDVPADTLAVARSRQVNKMGYVKRLYQSEE